MGLCVGREYTTLPLILALHLSCAFHCAQPAPTTGTPHASHSCPRTSYLIATTCKANLLYQWVPRQGIVCFGGEEPHEVWRLQGLVQGESLCRVAQTECSARDRAVGMSSPINCGELGRFCFVFKS